LRKLAAGATRKRVPTSTLLPKDGRVLEYAVKTILYRGFHAFRHNDDMFNA
jgi:hypothetical protein